MAVEGGPGYGSIGSARGYINTFGDLLDHRELILVDARGTGRSEPIDCPDMQSGRATDDVGMAACADVLGERFGSYRTAAAADDINDVRAALGYDRIQMYGDSYGTYLAQSYAFRHGDTLEALVLDSAYPVRGESPWYPSIWKTGIRGLSIACERSPSCHGDAGRRLERFVAELRERQARRRAAARRDQRGRLLAAGELPADRPGDLRIPGRRRDALRRDDPSRTRRIRRAGGLLGRAGADDQLQRLPDALGQERFMGGATPAARRVDRGVPEAGVRPVHARGGGADARLLLHRVPRRAAAERAITSRRRRPTPRHRRCRCS